MPDKRSAEATGRLITVLQVLADHPARGLEVSELLEKIPGYGGTHDGRKDAFLRDLRYLRRVGFQIDNTSGDGEEARYVLRPGDDRVRLAFTPDQLLQLQRAAVLVGVDGLGPLPSDASGSVPVIDVMHVPEALGDVQRAVASRALVRFEYAARSRTVHPYGLRIAPRGWVLEGWEQESGLAKVFSLHKMGEVRIGRPGTASPPERSARPTLDPLRFEYDAPVAAVLQVGTRFRGQVDAVLHHPLRAEPGPEVAGEATELLHFRVTNHSNFLVRVLRLDERVVLLGGPELRARLEQMLRDLAEVQ